MGLIESNDLFEEELVDSAKKDKLTVKWIQKALSNALLKLIQRVIWEGISLWIETFHMC